MTKYEHIQPAYCYFLVTKKVTKEVFTAHFSGGSGVRSGLRRTRAGREPVTRLRLFGAVALPLN
jgi:hypothetical protein